MAEEGAVVACHKVEEWQAHLQQANESKKLCPPSLIKEVVEFKNQPCQLSGNGEDLVPTNPDFFLIYFGEVQIMRFTPVPE